MSRDANAKAFAQQKRFRRRWLSFVRMCRYGVNNFSRNAWLTVAATAVMTITLLIIFMTAAASKVLVDSVAVLTDKLDMSIYLKTDTTQKQADELESELRKLSNVKQVSYISSEQMRAQNAEDNKSNPRMLEAINQATNQMPAALRVTLVDVNDTSQLDEFVKSNEKLKQSIHPEREPSFQGSRRSAIQNLGRWTDFAQRAGLGASVLFVAISMLIVFNTIRMAIFNRRDEIEMMKLIGADKGFIRGPFVVEAIFYGFIAALLATGIGIAILYATADGLQAYGVAVSGTVELLIRYIGFVLLAMIALGAILGMISSLLATRRYLKI